ncbi:hypothetical protein NPIL_670561 [Nephila pilipes]|uniref:Uncharacterized protein n=1 Tax=Nephila pilipes TaxID=299642 RepID=A0A8X6QXW2_NEPPI|nr:hypothetical protein NPIL_670561 [Nephila pilipes]
MDAGTARSGLRRRRCKWRMRYEVKRQARAERQEFQQQEKSSEDERVYFKFGTPEFRSRSQRLKPHPGYLPKRPDLFCIHNRIMGPLLSSEGGGRDMQY